MLVADRVLVVKPLPLPVAVTVMVAVPGATAVTTPDAVMVATAALDEVQPYATATEGSARVAVGTIVVD